jgi:hypothetical protein
VLLEGLTVSVAEADANALREEVVHTVSVWVPEGEALRVTDSEGEPEADAAGLPLSLCELLGLGDTLATAVAEAQAESDASALALRVRLTEPVAQAVTSAETEEVGEKEGRGEGDAAPEALVEGVELTELHGELLGEALAVTARVSVPRARST